MRAKRPLEDYAWSGLFAKPMRAITFWGMWLFFGSFGLLFAVMLVGIIREPFTLGTLIPVAVLGAGVAVFAGVLVRVTRHYVLFRKDEGSAAGGSGS